MAMIAMTTRSSIKVKAPRFGVICRGVPGTDESCVFIKAIFAPAGLGVKRDVQPAVKQQ
jgi:hypothetical protein